MSENSKDSGRHVLAYDSSPDLGFHQQLNRLLICIAVVAMLFVAIAIAHDQMPALKRHLAYAEGADEARAEIASKNSTIYFWGNDRSGPTIDKNTGLPFKWVGGCFVDQDAITVKVNGHNDAVVAYTATSGPLPNSHAWHTSLDDPEKYFNGRASSSTPIRLDESLPPIRDPSGSATLKLQRPTKDASGTNYELAVGHGVTTTIVTLWGRQRRTQEVSLIWSEPGAGLVVIKVHSPDAEEGHEDRFHVLELRSGFWLFN